MERLGTAATDLAHAAELLRAGKLVAFPTETVYGLGADAANPDAVAAIFAAKGRPADHPVIVHLASAASLVDWADPVPEVALRLADAFWPGPLTLVLRRARGVSDRITGGQDTVGVRVPNHPVARALLREFGTALAAPSANRFGRISPTTAQHVVDEFGDEVSAVIDGGACPVGVESTIVDLSSDRPRLLRPGMIRREAIIQAMGAPLLRTVDEDGPRASGRLASHYAPSTPLELVDGAELHLRLERCAREHERVVVLARSPEPCGLHKVAWALMPAQPMQYARRLYAELRAADQIAPDRILVEAVPECSAWDAIRDRLRRAASAED